MEQRQESPKSLPHSPLLLLGVPALLPLLPKYKQKGCNSRSHDHRFQPAAPPPPPREYHSQPAPPPPNTTATRAQDTTAVNPHSAPSEHHSRKGLPPCPQSTTGHLFGGERDSLLLSSNPLGWSRDHAGRSHQQESPQQRPVQHPEQCAQFSSKARSRAGVTVNADPGPRRWEPPKRASAQRGSDSDPPPHLPQPYPPASPPTSKVEV